MVMLLGRLRGRQFQPKTFFAWRSIEAQRQLKRLGRSTVDFSFHCATAKGQPNAYAADIIDRRYAWSNRPETEKFWVALGSEAKSLGLVWGGDWANFPDKAQVQALSNYELARVRRESGL